MKKLGIITLVLAMATVSFGQIVRIGIFTDVQVADRISLALFGDQSGPNLGDFYRDTRGGIAKTIEFVNRMNVWQPDIILYLGDIEDKNNTDAGAITMLTTIGAEFAKLTAPIASTLGNHETTQWDGVGGAPDMQDFFDNHYDTVIKENKIAPEGTGDDKNPWGYTTDVAGIRFICVYLPNTVSWPVSQWQGDGTYSDNEIYPTDPNIPDWLQDRLDECDAIRMPCIIFSHGLLWESDDAFFSLDSEDAATLYGYYDNSEYLQAIFGGHSHDGDGSIIRDYVYMLNPSAAITRQTSLVIDDIDETADPIEVSTKTDHGLSNGNTVYLMRCENPNRIADGTPLDGSYTISGITAKTFTLDGTDPVDWQGDYDNISDDGVISLDSQTTANAWLEIELEPAVVRTSTGWRPRIAVDGVNYCDDSRFPEKKINYDFQIFGAN